MRGRLRRSGGGIYYPTGLIQPWPWGSAPTGALLCDGSTYQASQYPALAGLVNPGGTTFTLPDWRGRTLVGAGTGPGLTNRPLGSTFGEETHVLTTTEMPSHTHPPGGDGTNYVVQYNASTEGHTTSPSGTRVTEAAPGAAGGGGGHNNMQPSYAVNWIVWT